MNLTDPDWAVLEPVRLTSGLEPEVSENVWVWQTNAGPLRIDFNAFGLRIRLGPEPAYDYGMLAGDTAAQPGTLDSKNDHALISGPGRQQLEVQAEPFSFALTGRSGMIQQSPTDEHFAGGPRLPAFARTPDGWFFALELSSGEPVYGLGEKWHSLDRRGQLIHSYNHDAQGVNAEKSYKNVPFAWSPRGWGAFVHTHAPVTHGVGHAPWSHRVYGCVVEGDSLDVFILHGRDGAALLKQFTALTGRSPEPPLWSLGAIMSKAYYRDADEFTNAAKEIRDHNMPCDVITLDGRAWQDTDTRFSFEFDATRYADPKPVLDAAYEQGFKVCLWEYPLVSVNNKSFQSMADRGWFLKDPATGGPAIYEFDKSPFGAVLTPLPDSGVIDFTHPDAYAYWRDSHRELFELGVHMIKTDFGEQVEDGVVAYNGETGRGLHNVYGLLYQRCVYEAAQKYAPSGSFLFSRVGWTGCQRYPGHWGGDPQADWEGLAASIRGGLSWGMSGGPFYATDIGGFYGDRRLDDLYVRWTQAAVFSSHMRFHGIGDRTPWSYSDEAAAAALEATRMRYRLLPYLHKTIKQSCESGLPVQRAMPLAFPNEPAAWGFDCQFMFGDDLLVAPCVRADGTVQAYLPQGYWRHFPSGDPVSGGRTLQRRLGLADWAVFAREGAKIELGAVPQFIDADATAFEVEEVWV